MKRPGRSSHGPGSQCLVRRLASVLLCYPDDRLYGQLDDVAACLADVPERKQREALGRCVAWLQATTATAAAQRHVADFDLRRRCSPYLTYYRYGDTRQRGMALLALKNTYRQAGFEPAGSELPDYLPAVLEFASLAPEAGDGVLTRHRPALALMRLALRDADSPYAAVLDAVCAGMPGLTDRETAYVRRLAADGPPKESVGLDPVGDGPFAPPELLGMAEPPESAGRR